MLTKQEMIQEIKQGADLIATHVKNLESDAPELNTNEVLNQNATALRNAVADLNTTLDNHFAVLAEDEIDELKASVFEQLGDDLTYVRVGIMLVVSGFHVNKEDVNNG